MMGQVADMLPHHFATRYGVSLATARRRVIAFGPTLEVGRFYDGTRRKIATTLNVRVRPGVIIYTAGEWNSVHLAAHPLFSQLAGGLHFITRPRECPTTLKKRCFVS